MTAPLDPRLRPKWRPLRWSDVDPAIGPRIVLNRVVQAGQRLADSQQAAIDRLTAADATRAEREQAERQRRRPGDPW